MNNRVASIQPSPSFFSLSLRPQLFLWTIRHLVYAVRWNRPVCAHVQKTFDLAQIPELPGMIDDLLHAVAQNAVRPIEVAHPQSRDLLKDERLLIDCLRAFQTRPDACGCHFFADMIEPGGLDSVMPRINLIAQTMNNCQRMAPLFCSSEAIVDRAATFTVH